MIIYLLTPLGTSKKDNMNILMLVGKELISFNHPLTEMSFLFQLLSLLSMRD
jgi:hypothetical protein